MTQAERYLEYLSQEGYRPVIDDDGDVAFKLEGGTYYLMVDESDPLYFRLLYPNFWAVESEEERLKADRVMGALNAELKVVKLYPHRDDTCAAIEMLMPDEDGFREVFPRAAALLTEAVTVFRRHMRNLN
jgi:hypothetical protein